MPFPSSRPAMKFVKFAFEETAHYALNAAKAHRGCLWTVIVGDRDVHCGLSYKLFAVSVTNQLLHCLCYQDARLRLI